MKTLELTSEQLDAVKAYAQDHGTGWKESLRSDWMGSGSHWGGPYHLLQQIRNLHGPRWLVDFRLNPETDGQILGWAWTVNSSSGLSHLIIDRDGIGVCACGTKGRTSGQVEKDPPQQPCKRCMRYAEKHTQTP